MINVAVYLKSESCDSYLYLYQVEDAKDIVSKLVEDNCEFESRCICDYEVESNNDEFNHEVMDLISNWLEGEED